MLPFMEKFRSLAEKETRCILIVANDKRTNAPPPDNYGLLEFYCDEKDCDCRRVMIQVFGEHQRKIFAVICMAFNPEDLEPGPYLDPMHPQSRHAQWFLERFVDMVNNDHNYLARLHDHYIIFREKVVPGKPYPGKPFPPPGTFTREIEETSPFTHSLSELPDLPVQVRIGPKIGRNKPCPCGSGKKYKKCCIGKSETTIKQPPIERKTRPDDGNSPPVNTLENQQSTAENLLLQTSEWIDKKDDSPAPSPILNALKRDPMLVFDLLPLLPKRYPDNNSDGNKENKGSYFAAVFLIDEVLTELRYEVDRKRPWAIEAAEQIQEKIANEYFHKMVDVEVQADLTRILFDSKIPLHPLIKEKSAGLAEYYAQFSSRKPFDQLEEVLDELINDLPHDQTGEFIETIMAEMNLLPVEVQVIACVHMANHSNAFMRENLSLLLLHSEKEIRQGLCLFYAELIDPVQITPVILRRMIGMRNWLPADEQADLDLAIRRARLAGVDCAPLDRISSQKFFTSIFDGSGMQVIYCAGKCSKRYQFSGLLICEGEGIRDAWCIDNIPLKEINTRLGVIKKKGAGYATDQKYLNLVIPHFIALGVEQGQPPSIQTFLVAEAMGMGYWQPRQMDFLSQSERLTDEADLSVEDREQILLESHFWHDMPEYASWFENSAGVDDLLPESGGEAAMKKAIQRVLSDILEPKRLVWQQRFLWMALMSKYRKDIGFVSWQSFLALSQAIKQGVKLADIPFMQTAAEISLMAAEQRAKQ